VYTFSNLQTLIECRKQKLVAKQLKKLKIMAMHVRGVRCIRASITQHHHSSKNRRLAVLTALQTINNK